MFVMAAVVAAWTSVSTAAAANMTTPSQPVLAAQAIRECGELRHRLAYNITTRKVGCRQARRVVRRWQNTISGSGRGGSGRVFSLYCHYRETGYEAADIRCTGPRGRVVRWQTYS